MVEREGGFGSILAPFVLILGLLGILIAASYVAPVFAEEPVCPDVVVADGGESLAEIGVRCLVAESELRAVNPHIPNPALLTAGERVIIPSRSPNGSAGGQSTTSLPSVHIVQTGETLGLIAVRYNTTVAELMRNNPQINDPQSIQPGMAVTIPANTVVFPTPVPPVIVVPQPDPQVVVVPQPNPQVVLIPNTGSPILDVQPVGGPPGTALTVTGLGFPANVQVNLGLAPSGGTAQPLTSAPVDANGRLVTQISLSPQAVPGQSWSVVAMGLDGRVLAASPAFTVTAPAANPAVVVVGRPLNYIVLSGDTLAEIASRYGTTVEALWLANPQLSGSTLIYPGQTLVIP